MVKAKKWQGSPYESVLQGMVGLLDSARRTAARSVNSIMTATYWEIGRRIVQQEQGGSIRAGYGEEVVGQLARDLTARFGRGFGKSSLFQMRAFFLAHSDIFQSPIGKFGAEISALADHFPLPWTAYVRLLGVRDGKAREFYEAEALRSSWTVRQLDRQVGSQFYERTLLSRDKAAMLTNGTKPRPGDAVTVEEEVKSPYVLEFLGLKDEYSEGDLEEALVRHLESFMLELGGDFAFVGRQKRLKIGDDWLHIDLVFFHRVLRCLVLVDLKLDRLTHADVGQMHTYCNYARRHWTHEGENPPVGLILCANRSQALAEYALEGLPNKVLAAEYRTALPQAEVLAEKVQRTRELLEHRRGPAR
jgi:predicted nuclease of restriction endonuclease-like (RecB) superfamily